MLRGGGGSFGGVFLSHTDGVRVHSFTCLEGGGGGCNKARTCDFHIL